MRLSQTAIYLFASLVAAAAEPATPSDDEPPTLVQRDLATVTSAFATVAKALTGLDTAVKGLNGAADIGNVQSASSALLSALNTGASNVKSSTDLTLQEAIQLQQVVSGLQTTGQSLANDLSSKKTVIQDLGLCQIVALQAADIAKSSKALSDAVVSKVPQAAQQIAAQMASGFSNALTQSQQTFAPGNCTNKAAAGGGSGSAPSSSAGSKPSATASSAPSTGTGSGTPGKPGTPFVAAAGKNLATGGVGLLGLAFAFFALM